MRFDTVFVEKEWINHPRAREILTKLTCRQVLLIDDYEIHWQAVKKSFIKRSRPRNLFLATLKQYPLQPAPANYGYPKGALHYFYSLGFNCPYACQYCFLQSYFHNDDLVFFLNWEDTWKAISDLVNRLKNSIVCFHDGNLWDSLALANVTRHVLAWRQFWETLPGTVFWEWRTKSAQLESLLQVDPHPNWIISWSVMPATLAKIWDLGAAPVESRFNAAKELVRRGFKIAFHFDPIIITHSWQKEWSDFLSWFQSYWSVHEIAYISLGVIRWPESLSKNAQVKQFLGKRPMTKTHDGYYRDPAWIRFPVLKYISQRLVSWGLSEDRLVWSMEESAASSR